MRHSSLLPRDRAVWAARSRQSPFPAIDRPPGAVSPISGVVAQLSWTGVPNCGLASTTKRIALDRDVSRGRTAVLVVSLVATSLR
ncbi:MAG: hypothetical protein H6R20_867 [Proteobacteria bacterium]|nr:hypothetical protein [Pseudomonadota bacterium]